ncbi:MAG: hypothetical protein JWM72_906, partial [Actinomycetia bacterium]|nr:hypothetical protein [Actinomycetes bacterium]
MDIRVGGRRRSGRGGSVWRVVIVAFVALVAFPAIGPGAGTAHAAGCAPPLTRVACENQLPGDPTSDWFVNGAGDPSIQGFATSMSVNAGSTVSFKINTPSTAYHLDILRTGYYQGNGAR